MVNIRIYTYRRTVVFFFFFALPRSFYFSPSASHFKTLQPTNAAQPTQLVSRETAKNTGCNYFAKYLRGIRNQRIQARSKFTEQHQKFFFLTYDRRHQITVLRPSIFSHSGHAFSFFILLIYDPFLLPPLPLFWR